MEMVGAEQGRGLLVQLRESRLDRIPNACERAGPAWSCLHFLAGPGQHSVCPCQIGSRAPINQPLTVQTLASRYLATQQPHAVHCLNNQPFIITTSKETSENTDVSPDQAILLQANCFSPSLGHWTT